MTTIAVIGCGRIANMAHFPALSKMDDVRIKYACDIIKEKANDYSERFDIEIIDSFEECLKREDINCVAIFSERHTHAPFAVAALNAGKDVYCAVPMACTPEECKEIIDAVIKSKRTYMMGETCIYYPCSMFCKQEMEKGTFGKFVFQNISSDCPSWVFFKSKLFVCFYTFIYCIF